MKPLCHEIEISDETEICEIAAMYTRKGQYCLQKIGGAIMYLTFLVDTGIRIKVWLGQIALTLYTYLHTV